MRFLRIVLALALLLGVSSACVPSIGGGGSMTVTAYFTDASGLFVGNDVGVLGVAIGKVDSITPEGDRVKVVMKIDADRAVPADVGAVVVARSVATDRYVELTPVYDSGPRLADGASIPVGRTAVPVDFDEVLGALNTFATGISGSKQGTQAVRDLIQGGYAALHGNGNLFNDTIKQLSSAVGSASGQRKDLSGTLVSLDRLVQTIAVNQQTARTFIHRVTTAADILDSDKVDFRTALRALHRAVTTVATFAADHRAEIVHTLGAGSHLMRTILSRQKQLTEVLQVFPLALQNLEATGTGPRIPVRIAPTSLLPLGNELQAACNQLPLGLCDLLNGTDPLGGIGGHRSGSRSGTPR